jgi:hypothetical protein
MAERVGVEPTWAFTRDRFSKPVAHPERRSVNGGSHRSCTCPHFRAHPLSKRAAHSGRGDPWQGKRGSHPPGLALEACLRLALSLCQMVPPEGLAPSRSFNHKALNLARATISPRRHEWWARRDSHPHAFRHRLLKPARATISPRARMVGDGGVEPALDLSLRVYSAH